MKRIYGILAVAGLCALGGAAQDAAQQDKLKLEMQQMLAKMGDKVFLVSSVMGPAVKGAPYSGEEVRETTQILGDGTRIHNESKTLIFRDNEGRVRRETPTEISISDPVANVSYALNPRTQTARKMSMGTAVPLTYKVVSGVNGRESTVGYSVTSNSETAVTTARALEEARAKMEAAAAGRGGRGVMVRKMTPANRETLGTQMIEGVNSEGVRETMTLEAGAIGNDRPIQTATESWYSKDLQTNILTKHTDPRTGEETVRIINIRRGDPGLSMFQVPSGYTVVEAK